MCKIKKIIAGILNIVIMIGVLPVSVTAEEADYVYYEDFEGDTYNEKYDVIPGIVTNGTEFKNELVEESTNTYMKYYAQSTDASENNGVFLKLDEIIPLERNEIYEIAFKFDPAIGDNLFNPYLNGIQLKARTNKVWNGIDIFGMKINMYGDTTFFGQTLITNKDTKATFAPDGFIEVKISINTDTGMGSRQYSYVNKEGIPVVFNQSYSMNLAEGDYVKSIIGLSLGTVARGQKKYECELAVDDIYIKKLKTYTVTFDSNDGSENTKEVKTDASGNVIVPEMNREGYHLEGWYLDPECSRPFDNTDISEDMTVYAKWLKIYYVSFDANGGEEIESIGTYDGTVDLPETTKERHEFVGWFKDPDCTISFDGTNVFEDVTVYAKWAWANEISFETNGGNEIEPIYVVSEVKSLPQAQYKGYRFDGWFSDGDVGYSVDSGNVDEIAKKIIMICDNYSEISNRCIEEAKKFNWEDLANRYKEIYSTIIECK